MWADKVRKTIVEEFGPVAYTAGGVTLYSKVLSKVEGGAIIEVAGTVPTDVLVGRITGVGTIDGGTVVPNAFTVRVYGVLTGTVVGEYSGTISSIKALLTGP
jgi:hypothetical protein